MKLIFAGTPDFSVPALEALIQAGHQIVAVYTQPDRPAGRGRKLSPSPVKACAISHHIPVEQPLSLKDPEAQQTLAKYDADIMVVVAYGLLLPETVLNTPKQGCINIHASLLPRWRGAAPIQRAIAAGDKESGVTIMQMDIGLDTGDMLSREAIPIEENETGGSLHDKLSELGARMIVSALKNLDALQANRIEQINADATYAHKLSKKEAVIDWNESAQTICQKIRAFNPWPVAYTEIAREKARVWSAHIGTSNSKHAAGRIAYIGKDHFDVQCGQGTVSITQLQMPGKKPCSARDYLNAHSLIPGQRLSDA